MKPLDLSIVIPMYNEQENVDLMMEEVLKAMEPSGYVFEVLCVDDGSQDGTFEKVKQWHEKDARIKAISFRKNYGQMYALRAGFEFAKGRFIAIIDADLQNYPEDIPRLARKLEEGYDLVNGYRAERTGSFLRKVPSRVANWIEYLITGLKLKDYGSGLKAFRSELIEDVSLFSSDSFKYFVEFFYWQGARIAEIEIKDRARIHGRSRYNFFGLFYILIERYIIFSTKPIQLFIQMALGLVSISAGVILGIYITIDSLVNAVKPSTNLLLLVILCIFLGIQFFSMGFLSERITRLYRRNERGHGYAIREKFL